MAQELEYPIPKFRFTVDLGGEEVSAQEVTGLESEVEFIEYRTGDHPTDVKMKVPGLQKVSNITIKRGLYNGNNYLFDWFQQVKDARNENGSFEEHKRQVLITLMDTMGNPVFKWTLTNAFPVKLSAPDLNAEDNGIAIETIELAHEGLMQEIA